MLRKIAFLLHGILRHPTAPLSYRLQDSFGRLGALYSQPQHTAMHHFNGERRGVSRLLDKETTVEENENS